MTLAQEKPATNSTPPAASAAQPAPPANSSAMHIIGHLEKADRVLTIKSGPKGLVYSVQNKAGKLLFENLSAEQLRAQAPELHELIKTGQAATRARGKDAGVKVDASLRSNLR